MRSLFTEMRRPLTTVRRLFTEISRPLTRISRLLIGISSPLMEVLVEDFSSVALGVASSVGQPVRNLLILSGQCRQCRVTVFIALDGPESWTGS